MKRLLISMTILALLIVPQFALGDDMGDLKATYEKAIQAWNNLDAETIASMVYPGAVSFDYDAAFPGPTTEITQEQRANMLKTWFNNVEYISISPYNLQYKVVGNTGIIWGHGSMSIKMKGEPAHTLHQRITTTWIKSNGKWFMLIAHNSAIPPSN